MKGNALFDVILLVCLVLFAVIGLFSSLSDKESIYTQPEVSALMKFNASEFGCSYFSSNKNSSTLSVFCHPLGWGDKFVKEILDWNKKGYSFSDSTGNNAHFVYYFLQWSNISIILEPEKQECVNETIKVVNGYVLQPWENSFNIDDLIFKNITKCTTIPAVTKTLSGWAENENDLVTEFCKAKTYVTTVTDLYNNCLHTYMSCLNENVNSDSGVIQCGDNYQLCNKNVDALVLVSKSSIISKSFIRGEVVEVEISKQKTCEKDNNVFCRAFWEMIKLKQKVVHCSDGDYSQDFEVFK